MIKNLFLGVMIITLAAIATYTLMLLVNILGLLYIIYPVSVFVVIGILMLVFAYIIGASLR